MAIDPGICRRLAVLCVFTAALCACAVGESRPPVTTEQVIQMSKDGVPAADIIQKMREAGTVYRLSGSKLAALRGEGVPDEVLDYMQDTYLAQQRAQGAMDYSYWDGSWGWGPYPYAGYWGPRGYWGPYWGPYWGYPYPYRPRPPKPRPPPKPPPPAALQGAPGAVGPAGAHRPPTRSAAPIRPAVPVRPVR